MQPAVSTIIPVFCSHLFPFTPTHPRPISSQKTYGHTNLLFSQSRMSIRALSRSLGGIASRVRPVYLGQRNASTLAQKDLKETLKEVIPAKRERLKKLKVEHGEKVLGEVKVENAIGGMRSAFFS